MIRNSDFRFDLKANKPFDPDGFSIALPIFLPLRRESKTGSVDQFPEA